MNTFMWFIMITSFEILSQNNIISLRTLMQWTLLHLHYLNSMFHSFISLYANAIKFASCIFYLSYTFHQTSNSFIFLCFIPIKICLFTSSYSFVPLSFIFLCCHWNQKNCEVYIILFYWFHAFLYLCLFVVVNITKFTSPSALFSYIL